MTYADHPLAALFPLLDADEASGLAADIAANGQQEAIVLFEDRILDGRNRYRACIAAGVEPVVKEYEGVDPLAFVLSHNLHRRHLNESQRAMVAAKLATMKRGRPEENVAIVTISQTQAAEKLNVSRGSVIRAAAVQKHGTPELQEQVQRGEKSVSAAAKEVRPKSQAEQLAEVEIVPPASIHSPSYGLQYAETAISQLEKIHAQDTQRTEAFAKVRAWLDRNN